MTGKLCPQKIKHASLMEALIVLKILRRKPRYAEARVYKCPHCYHWHVTGSPRRHGVFGMNHNKTRTQQFASMVAGHKPKEAAHG